MNANPDGFDCFRRAYVAECLLEAAAAMPDRKRRQFRQFLQRLVNKNAEQSALNREGGR